MAAFAFGSPLHLLVSCADYADINKALVEFQEVAVHVNESMRRADEMYGASIYHPCIFCLYIVYFYI